MIHDTEASAPVEPDLPAEFEPELVELRLHLPRRDNQFCTYCGWQWSTAFLDAGHAVAGCLTRRTCLQIVEDCDVLPDCVVIERWDDGVAAWCRPYG